MKHIKRLKISGFFFIKINSNKSFPVYEEMKQQSPSLNSCYLFQLTENTSLQVMSTPRIETIRPRNSQRRERHPGTRERHSGLRSRLHSASPDNERNKSGFNEQHAQNRYESDQVKSDISRSHQTPTSYCFKTVQREYSRPLTAQHSLTLDDVKRDQETLSNRPKTAFAGRVPKWMLDLDVNLDISCDVIPPYDDSQTKNEPETFSEDVSFVYLKSSEMSDNENANNYSESEDASIRQQTLSGRSSQRCEVDSRKDDTFSWLSTLQSPAVPTLMSENMKSHGSFRTLTTGNYLKNQEKGGK